jgi:hypothetical protein
MTGSIDDREAEMNRRRFRRLVLVVMVVLGVLVSASAASAAITPSVSPGSSAAVTAGATGNLGLALKFAPTGNDTPKDVTLNLPPGLLANAALDNGGCLQTTDIQTSTCQVGSGTVDAVLDGAIPVPTNVGFFLVPPPSPNDLAGLAVAEAGDQIGTTAPIVIRPSGDPDGVGVTIELALPNTLEGQALSITEIDSTFTGLRFPSTCPSAPAPVTVSADSYADPTVKGAQTPLPVTGCSSLGYQPKYSLNVARDSGDRVVKVSTTITQGAAESPNSSIVLAFPSNVIAPSLSGLSDLCSTGATAGCTPVGSVTAASPLYPKPLAGKAYLTGQATNITGLTLTLVFPPPFPLTLVGKVDLVNVTATFSGLPDIPLTNLGVTLNGGTNGLFASLCAPSSGTSTATLTDQNGDKTATDPAAFTVSGCPAGSGGGSGGGNGNGSGGGGAGAKAGKPKLAGATLAGLTSGKPRLSFTATAGRRAPKLRSLTVSLPKGLTVIAKRVHGQQTVPVGLTGAKLKSARLEGGKLVITASRPAHQLTVTLTGLRESASLKAKARAKQVKGLKLGVVVRNAKGKRTAASAAVTLKG